MSRKHHFLCVNCGDKVKPLDNDFTDKPPENKCWAEGVVNTIYGGYGSDHDMAFFIVAICDTCVTELVKQKKLHPTPRPKW